MPYFFIFPSPIPFEKAAQVSFGNKMHYEPVLPRQYGEGE